MTIAYRPEIDGLRAVAVVSVILFHAGAPLFGGGYVGVDVFFVISGYLITSIILAEFQDGSFSFARFYERRARRILPAAHTAGRLDILCAGLGLTVDDHQTKARDIDTNRNHVGRQQHIDRSRLTSLLLKQLEDLRDLSRGNTAGQLTVLRTDGARRLLTLSREIIDPLHNVILD